MAGERKRSWADGWPGAALVVAVVIAVFARSLSGEFVWDDHRFVTENPHVLRPASWLAFLTDAGLADTYGAHGIVRPLRTLEFAVDHALFGLSPLAFRIHSLLWHLAAALLLLAVLRRLVGDGRVAILATLFWAVHPANTEAVAFVSSRGDVAMGACSLAAILFALRSEGFDRNLAISLAAAFVAALYKETAVALPLVIAALRWTKLARVRVWPHFAVAAAYLAYRAAVKSGDAGHDVTFVLGGGVAGTFATMIRAFGFYVADALLPAEAFDWYLSPSTSFADAAVIGWLAVHVAILATAVALRTRAPRVTLGIAWFYACFAAVANWPVFLGVPTTERFMYLPLAGAAVAFAWALSAVPRARAAGVVIVAAFAIATIGRCAMWTSDTALWTTAGSSHASPRDEMRRAKLARSEVVTLQAKAFALPEGPEREAALGELRRAGEEALGHAHRALDLWYEFELTSESRNPLVRDAELTASNVAYILGRFGEALFHANEAVRIDESADPYAQYDRAMPLLRMGAAPQAIAAMRRAVELGARTPSEELGRFFRDAATACEGQRLFATAESGYAAAVDAAGDGAIREDARARLATLRALTRTPGVDAAERDALRQFDEALARTPLACPARRDHALHR
jgi:tetratricopeptide (TPR) repeat protein